MAKKQKRMSRAELREPDRVEVVLSSWWSHIAEYWKIMVAGCVGLLVAGGVHSFWKTTMVEADFIRSDALTQAMNPLTSPLTESNNPFGGGSGNKERSPLDPLTVSESFSDGLTAIVETNGRLDTYLAEHGEAEGASSVRFLRAALELSDAGARLGAMETVVADDLDPLFRPSALMLLAAAQADNGERDKAAATYEKAAGESSGAVKALAISALGDLRNPFMFGDGDAEAAKAKYEEARQIFGDLPPAAELDYLDQLAIPLIHAELDNKIAILQ